MFIFKLLSILILSETSFAGLGSELCEQRGSPVHGVTHLKLRRPSGIAVVYTCEPGYTLHGAGLAVCVHGVWTHPLPSCNRIVASAVNDGIAGDSGVIVSMSELDNIPPPIQEEKYKKQTSENNDKQKKGRRKKRKRKGKRKGRNRMDRKKVADRQARPPTARRKLLLDMSCLLGTMEVPGFVRAPRIQNAFVPKYSRRKNQKGRYLAAYYTCAPGFTLRNPEERSLSCSEGRWVGRRPVCSPVNGVVVASSSCTKARCEHDCKEVEGRPQCFCFKGFKQDGRSCHDINECTEDNGGCEDVCTNTPGSYYCQCKQGFRLSYDRSSCEDINECILRNGHGPCQGECLNKKGSYQCSCDGIPGTQLGDDRHSCEDIDECTSTKYALGCSHSCINTIGTAFCHCPEGFALGSDWKTCSDIDECELEEFSLKCDFGCVNTQGSYRCALTEEEEVKLDAQETCIQGFENENEKCKETDACDNSPCSQDCLNTPTSYACSCSSGYNLGDDEHTCHDIDECAEYSGGTLCSHVCINTVGSYLCECPHNYELASDRRTCHPMEDECQKKNCSHDCSNVNGTAICVCDDGFYLEDDSTCVDTNECSGDSGCSHECVNEEGSFRCSCPEEFYLTADGKNCESKKDCPVECVNGCINDSETLKCKCPTGFSLKDDQISCEDINECLIAEQNNTQICSFQCTNTEGSYICDCPDGFRLGTDKRTCEDINECLLKIDEDASICSHFCTNTPGSYSCGCPVGFILARDSRTCEDIDECLDNNEINNRCSHDCINDIGSYHCECPDGYTIEKNICKETNECEVNNGGCSHICINKIVSVVCKCPEEMFLSNDNVTCLETNSSRNICSEGNILDSKTCTILNECAVGYRLNNDSRTCDDINECDIDNGGCSQTCTNNRGSFSCSCLPGFELESEVMCADINECDGLNLIDCSNCENTPGSYMCHCEKGYVFENGRCSDIDECGGNQCSQTCVNTVGSFYCECEEGSLSEDGVSCLTNKTDVITCKSGHRSNNETCEDIDECLENSNCSQICETSLGSFFCKCEPGYVLSADNRTCLDVDECLIDTSCSHLCENTVGGFTCACNNGYTLQNGSICVETVDPCRLNNGGCEMYCNSTTGSVVCSCGEGFYVNGSQCVDIDECEDNTCDQKCVNTKGSYQCVCHGGFYRIQNKCLKIPGCKPIKSRPHLTSNCPTLKGELYSVGAECSATCNSGFKLDGLKVRTCQENGSWSGNDQSCLPVARPFIRCQREIRHILHKGQNESLIHIPQPKTNMDWKRDVESKPTWGKQLKAKLPAGVTRVTFTVNSPDSKAVSSCTVMIHIVDTEKPEVEDCPKNILLWLKPGSKTQKVIWSEPVFKDNVKIAHLYKSKIPGQEFQAGVHLVSYVVADSSGNIETCQFTVTIKDTTQATSSPTAMLQHPTGPLDSL